LSKGEIDRGEIEQEPRVGKSRSESLKGNPQSTQTINPVHTCPWIKFFLLLSFSFEAAGIPRGKGHARVSASNKILGQNVEVKQNRVEIH
jgi:hypothetical protein